MLNIMQTFLFVMVFGRCIYLFNKVNKFSILNDNEKNERLVNNDSYNLYYSFNTNRFEM